MPFGPDHIGHFRTLASIRPPRVTRVIALMLIVAIAASVVFLLAVRWVQTAPGTGTIIALDPRDRLQNITAMVPGQVVEWFVSDGDTVRRGDPIARIADTEPRLLDRLRAERDQLDAEIAAGRQAQRVAQLDVARMGELYREGLVARRDYEAAQIKVADYAAKVAQGLAKRNQIEINLGRQSLQTVRAPRAGRIMRIAGGDTATMVKAGDVLATFAPGTTRLVAELYVDGRDVPLINPGRRVRLEFEGWPAIQFSGWPSIAQGMFDGRVRSIDEAVSPNGLYRVLVEPAADRPAWPRAPYVRLGAKLRGWVLMDEVTVGFELWRQLNDFPLVSTTARPSKFGTPEQTAAETGAAAATDAK